MPVRISTRGYMTKTELYRYSKNKLADAGIANAGLEMYALFELLLGVDKTELLTHSLDECSAEQAEVIKKAVDRRISGYPLQYITGIWDFYGYQFYVGEGVLIPRSDTEVLVDAALGFIDQNSGCVVADLCSGTGCVGITLGKLLPKIEVHLLEYSDKAIEYIHKNIKLNGAVDTTVHRADVLSKSAAGLFDDGTFDLLVSNPPYLTDDDMGKLQYEVEFEPKMALYGGNDGLYFYRGIAEIWERKIKQGGKLVFEVGINQCEDVSQILLGNNFCDIRTYEDFSGIKRVVSGEKK